MRTNGKQIGMTSVSERNEFKSSKNDSPRATLILFPNKVFYLVRKECVIGLWKIETDVMVKRWKE